MIAAVTGVGAATAAATGVWSAAGVELASTSATSEAKVSASLVFFVSAVATLADEDVAGTTSGFDSILLGATADSTISESFSA